ncbi:TatD family hydrolase [Motiliproteus sp. SC1-56]|uniref:TatD family hydrolase n=1 Tax=Motiliproteus sp. SC1-56 TaxID=2799565 RepID=UPI001A8E3397|nr:TatD family hydrolase [Motiliproteus sp. SC1-56]
MLVDSHCHLDRLDLSPYDGALEPVIENAREAGVERMLCVGTDLSRWATMMALIAPYESVSASAGVHPMSKEVATLDVEGLERAVADPRVVAVGETGLDYHYTPDTANAQRAAFRTHLELAARYRKPVIIHTRNAQEDTLALLRDPGHGGAGGVLHCFTESWEMARQALDLGYHISFSGIITFRNAASLREVVKQVPLDRMLVETDAPYLTPVPFRGRSNEPCYTRQVAECVADVKGLSYDEVAEATTRNFDQLFALR